MLTIGAYIREKRENKGLSYRELASLSGISHTHIKRLEDEIGQPSFEVLIKILNALMVDISDFLKDTGYIRSNVEPEIRELIKTVPVISWTQAGNWREVSEEYQNGGYEEYIQTDTKGEFALKIRGDSMEPEFYEGDIIVVNPYLKQEHNDYIVLCNEEGEATFKQLKKYGKATRILHPLNPKYEDIELKRDVQYRVIGVVIEKKRKYR